MKPSGSSSLETNFENLTFVAVMGVKGWARWSGPWEKSATAALLAAAAAHPGYQFSVVRGGDFGSMKGADGKTP